MGAESKPSALAQVENAIDLLKRLSAGAWLLYLSGAVPMTMVVLWFARDMLTPENADRCLPDALLCAAVFLFASFWKARFAHRLALTLDDRSESAEIDRNNALQCAFIQGCLQTVKLAVLPLATISVLPLPWTSTLFRSVSAESNRQGATVSNTLRRAAAQASANTGSGALVFTICAGAGLVAFANLFLMSLLLPQLLKSFTGVESEWTRTGGSWFDGNLFRAVLALTWLLVDPLLQACSAVRRFEYEARADGRDLLLQLRRLPYATVLLVVLAFGYCPAQASQDRTHPSLTADEVTRAIEKAKAQDEFAWLKAPRPTPHDNWFGARLVRDGQRVLARLAEWRRQVEHWLDEIFRRDRDSSNPSKPEYKIAGRELRWLLYAASAVLAIAVIVLLIRTRRRRAASALDGTVPSSTGAIDVAAELLASEHGEEEWLATARAHAERGELRLAVRALYLSNLAYLGAQHLIGIQRSKSNGIYERELRSRCRSDSVVRSFAHANRAYERVWYGSYEVTPELHLEFERNGRLVRGHA